MGRGLVVVLGLLLACDRVEAPTSEPMSDPTVPSVPSVPTRVDVPDHDAWCARELDPRFVSRFACEYDSDCLICLCEPIDRGELARRGIESCVSETREECVVTNARCCDGRCVGLP